MDFDDYADEYEELLRTQLAFFSSDRDYFSSFKVDILARLGPRSPATILDFGCGIGLSLPHLRERFSGARIWATDVSPKSVEYVRNNYPGVEAVAPDRLEGERFDVVFVTGVLHHVAAAARPGVMARLAELLKEGGTLCVFEHNPFNPVTRYLVATCPFDADAELLTLRQLRRLVAEAGLREIRSEYCLLVPPALKALRALERFVSRLPLGGQYVTVATK